MDEREMTDLFVLDRWQDGSLTFPFPQTPAGSVRLASHDALVAAGGGGGLSSASRCSVVPPHVPLLFFSLTCSRGEPWSRWPVAGATAGGTRSANRRQVPSGDCGWDRDDVQPERPSAAGKGECQCQCSADRGAGPAGPPRTFPTPDPAAEGWEPTQPQHVVADLKSSISEERVLRLILTPPWRSWATEDGFLVQLPINGLVSEDSVSVRNRAGLQTVWIPSGSLSSELPHPPVALCVNITRVVLLDRWRSWPPYFCSLNDSSPSPRRRWESVSLLSVVNVGTLREKSVVRLSNGSPEYECSRSSLRVSCFCRRREEKSSVTVRQLRQTLHFSQEL